MKIMVHLGSFILLVFLILSPTTAAITSDIIARLSTKNNETGSSISETSSPTIPTPAPEPTYPPSKTRQPTTPPTPYPTSPPTFPPIPPFPPSKADYFPVYFIPTQTPPPTSSPSTTQSPTLPSGQSADDYGPSTPLPSIVTTPSPLAPPNTTQGGGGEENATWGLWDSPAKIAGWVLLICGVVLGFFLNFTIIFIQRNKIEQLEKERKRAEMLTSLVISPAAKAPPEEEELEESVSEMCVEWVAEKNAARALTISLTPKPIKQGKRTLVFLGIKQGKQKEPVAVKVLRKKENYQREKDRHLAIQLKALQDERTEYILPLLAYNDTQFSLITQYCELGDVKHYLRAIPNLDIRTKVRLALDVAHGIIAVQQAGFIHGDLAARNCLLTKDSRGVVRCKIGDFGSSQPIWSDVIFVTGDNRRLPPEIVLLYESKYKIGVDSYSFALFLWELWTNCEKEPFYQCRTKEQLKSMYSGLRRDKLPIDSALDMPDARMERERLLKEVICECLSWNEEARKSMWVIKTHPVFQGIGNQR